MDRILSGGVLLPQLEPEFPASSTPFLVSLLTGVHSGSHGIFAEHIFSDDEERVESIDHEALWEDAKGVKSLWVGFYYLLIEMLGHHLTSISGPGTSVLHLRLATCTTFG